MYIYEEEKHNIFTEDGIKMLLKIRDNTLRLIKEAGCVNMENAIKGNSGSNWTMMACVDYMIENGEIKEIDYGKCPGQYRIFTRYFD